MRILNRFLHSCVPFAAAFACVAGSFADTADPVEVFISVPDQYLAVLRDGEVLGKFRISTSKFGIGDTYGSYQTPLGDFRIYSKVGDGLPAGSVMRGRHATGEVLAANAPGRDPIVTRILWLEGCESCNEHARARGIYIHGTPEESKLGQPASYGCIRMKSGDVVKVFDWAPVGCHVRIETRKLRAIVGEKTAAREARIAAARKSDEKAPVASEQKVAVAKAPEKKAAPSLLAGIAGKAANKLMSGSILDYDSFNARDTVGVRGSEVRMSGELSGIDATPHSPKLAASRAR